MRVPLNRKRVSKSTRRKHKRRPRIVERINARLPRRPGSTDKYQTDSPPLYGTGFTRREGMSPLVIPSQSKEKIPLVEIRIDPKESERVNKLARAAREAGLLGTDP